MTRLLRRSAAVGAAAVLFVVMAVGTGAAQQYPPGGVEVSCNVTVAPPGAEVRCSISPGTFEPGTPVTVDIRVTADGRSVGGPGLAMASGALLAQQDGKTAEMITKTVTAERDGSVAVDFQVPDDAAPGSVDLAFQGTAPDGSSQQVTENGAVEVVASQPARGSVSVAESGSSAWVWVVAVLGAAGTGIVVASRRRRAY